MQYMEIDGPHGTEIVPCDVDNFDVPEIRDFPKQGDCEDNRAIPGPLAMYCENEWAYTIERKAGWVGRMSAPGYMDCTSWIAGDSEESVRAELDRMYGDEDDDMSAEEPITSDERASAQAAERNRE
jgi:hypothetical protein